MATRCYCGTIDSRHPTHAFNPNLSAAHNPSATTETTAPHPDLRRRAVPVPRRMQDMHPSATAESRLRFTGLPSNIPRHTRFAARAGGVLGKPRRNPPQFFLVCRGQPARLLPLHPRRSAETAGVKVPLFRFGSASRLPAPPSSPSCKSATGCAHRRRLRRRTPSSPGARAALAPACTSASPSSPAAASCTASPTPPRQHARRPDLARVHRRRRSFPPGKGGRGRGWG